MWRDRRRQRKRNSPDKGKEEMTGDLSRNDLDFAIQQWIIGRNGERDRVILAMYLFDGITFARMQDRLETMGYELGIDQIKKIVRKRKEELFRHV